MLKKVGFQQRTGKGSHTNWFHLLYSGRVTISGKEGEDAKEYLEKEVLKAIEEVERKRNDG